jgi:hypothetical protein
MKNLYIVDTNTTRYMVVMTVAEVQRLCRILKKRGLTPLPWAVPAFRRLPSGRWPGECPIGDLG